MKRWKKLRTPILAAIVALVAITAGAAIGFTYHSQAAVQVTNISPTSGDIAGGETVTITGTDLSLSTIDSATLTSGMGMTSRFFMLRDGDTIYMPSESGRTLEIYDIATKTTVALNSLTNGLTRGGAMLYNGKIYMPEDSGTRLEIYDIANDTVTFETLQTDYSSRSLLYDGKIYRQYNLENKMEIYDIATGNSVIKNLPSSATIHTMLEYNGRIFMTEGSNSNILYIYDVAAGNFTTRYLSGYSFKFCSTLYDGKIYFPRFNASDMDVYDIASNTVSVVSLPAMGRFTCQAIDGKIYMPQDDGSSIMIYDIANGNYVTETLPTTNRHYVSMVVDGKLYLPDRSGGNQMDIYDPHPLTVTFDGVPATNVTVLNDTTATVVTPAHAAGFVDVVVTLGSDTITLTDGYEYIDPTPPVVPPVVPPVNPPVVPPITPPGGGSNGSGDSNSPLVPGAPNTGRL